ncbi:conserved hypothetical protein [Tenacibaculum ascidiaceicola]
MSLNGSRSLSNFNFFKMKKSILNLGKVLNKTNQKQVNGGSIPRCCLDWNPIERHCYRWQSGCL